MIKITRNVFISENVIAGCNGNVYEDIYEYM